MMRPNKKIGLEEKRKIEKLRATILLENDFLPGDLEAFFDHCKARFFERLPLTPTSNATQTDPS
ncbi:MAG: hypothetical protein ABJQ34_04255 [Paracoccaceae bacterium]